MAFISGSTFFVACKPESGLISDSFESTTPATLPTKPTLTQGDIVGYCEVPEQKRGLNNSLAFVPADSKAMFRKRGRREPSLSFSLFLGARDFLANAVRNGSDHLPYLCIWVGVPGVWTDVYRFAKVNTLTLSGKEQTGEAAEIGASVEVMALAVESLFGDDLPSPTVINSGLTAMRSDFELPLFWHDVRQLTIKDANNDSHSKRDVLEGFSVQINHNLRRAGCRPDYGDAYPLANSAWELIEGSLQVQGSFDFWEPLDNALLGGSGNINESQRWGDVVLSIAMPSTIPSHTTRHALNLTLSSCFAQDMTRPRTPLSGTQQQNVSWLAQGFSLA